MKPQKAQVKDKGLRAECWDFKPTQRKKSGARRARIVDSRIKSPKKLVFSEIDQVPVTRLIVIFS